MSSQVLITLALHDMTGLVSYKRQGKFIYGARFNMQIKMITICTEHQNQILKSDRHENET